MGTPDDVTGPINLGNPCEYRVGDLAELIVDLTGSSSKIEFGPLPADDPTQRCPDISKAKALLQWEPSIPLREGLMRTIAYFEALLGGGDFRAARGLGHLSAFRSSRGLDASWPM